MSGYFPHIPAFSESTCGLSDRATSGSTARPLALKVGRTPSSSSKRGTPHTRLGVVSNVHWRYIGLERRTDRNKSQRRLTSSSDLPGGDSSLKSSDTWPRRLSSSRRAEHWHHASRARSHGAANRAIAAVDDYSSTGPTDLAFSHPDCGDQPIGLYVGGSPPHIDITHTVVVVCSTDRTPKHPSAFRDRRNERACATPRSPPRNSRETNPSATDQYDVNGNVRRPIAADPLRCLGGGPG